MTRSTDGGTTWTVLPALPRICSTTDSDPCPFGEGYRNIYPTIHAMGFPAAAPDPVLNLSSASFVGGALAPDSLVSAFGTDLGSATATAPDSGPVTSLAGVSITVEDSAGNHLDAPLILVSPTQINYLMPAGTAPGPATITVNRPAGGALRQRVQITGTAPGLFTLNLFGLAAAAVVRVRGSDVTYEAVYDIDESGAVVPHPIDFGPETDQLFLAFYGTGFRSAGTEKTTMTLDGFEFPVLYAAAQGEYAGLDQANVYLPRTLAGAGLQVFVLKAAGQPSNTVTVTFK